MEALNLSAAALLVIDMQHDFIDGSLPVPNARDILPQVKYWIDIFRDLDKPILYSLDWHPRVTPHFDRWPVHCVAKTYGAQMHDDVTYDPAASSRVYTVQKGLGDDDGYSVCSKPSEIFRINEEHRIQYYGSVGTVLMSEACGTVLVVGLATDYCVRASVLDLLKMNFNVIVDLSAVQGVASASTEAAIKEMQDAGAHFCLGERRLEDGVDVLALA